MGKKDITRRQHYVWQKYLEPWKHDNKVWCLRDGKVFNVSSKNVLLERDMYKVHDLNKSEQKYLDLLMQDNRKEIDKIVKKELAMLRLMNDFDKVNPGLIMLILKETLGLTVSHKGEEIDLNPIINDMITNDHPEIREKVSKIVKDFRIQHGEDLMSINEGEGQLFLDKLLSEDIDFFDTENSELLYFYGFLMSQYLRTAKMKNRLIENIEKSKQEFLDFFNLNEEMDGSKIYSHMVHSLITKSSFGLYSDKSFKIVLYVSKDKKFITSDQPVMNICDAVDENGVSTQMNIFMSISPNKSFLISKEHEKNEVVQVNKNKVDYFNKLIVKYSLNNLIGDTEDILKEL